MIQPHPLHVVHGCDLGRLRGLLEPFFRCGIKLRLVLLGAEKVGLSLVHRLERRLAINLILVAAFLSHIELPLGWLAIPLAVMIGSNYLLGRLSRKTNARRALGLSLAIDIVALTAVLALSGGSE